MILNALNAKFPLLFAFDLINKMKLKYGQNLHQTL